MLGLLICKAKTGGTMSQYKYGMYVKDIAKIKREIVVLKKSDEDVMKKWGISKGQLGFIHDVLLKGQFRTIERRVSNLERGFSPLRDNLTKSFTLHNNLCFHFNPFNLK